MLGERSAQRGLFEADTMFAEFVGRRNFYGFLAAQRDELLRDEDFAALYCSNNGAAECAAQPAGHRAGVASLRRGSRMTTPNNALTTTCGGRWRWASNWDVRPFAKSTLQEFRAQLIVHDQTRAIFQRSLEVAKRRGVWKRVTRSTSGNT